jgi:hypothetical protein
MGVYYFFYNVSKNNEQNSHVINGRFCDFVTKFDSYTIAEQDYIFKHCIKLNDWGVDDVILAVPDYYDHDVIKYHNGNITIDNSDKNNYFYTEEDTEEDTEENENTLN